MSKAIMLEQIGVENIDANSIRSVSCMFGQINNQGTWDGTFVFPETIFVPKLENCIYAQRMFIGNSNSKYITLGGFSHDGVNLYEMFRGRNPMITHITLLDDIYPISMERAFDSTFGVYGTPGTITGGRFNCNLCTNMILYGGEYIGHIEFVENTILVDFFAAIGARDYIDNESLISIANGLNENVYKTLKLNNAKHRFPTILGTVSLSEDETYHIFTEDASGDTNLQDFITNVKGWTIA